ncbi:putative bifunctional diguanylate cyclase/phosphodiesterase [Sphingorhabdus sp.]|jgi:diguanylate cyclase (GGDEF)-like protein|uniref:putative bifunctional diguanylate cyclase/phosphodiesterase n=1 Tax=Sphingorhabdus sp. TaxID=1902408 RepID=UPI003BAFA0A3|nr:EAL domain-containing protein [Sphingomonadales bacterium]MBK9431095.1 EAL domain-containing protein [Sphingomonadales bacterium]
MRAGRHNMIANKLVAARSGDSWLLRRQLEEFASTVPGAAAGNLINGAITVVLMRDTVPWPLLGTLALGLCALVVWRFLIARQANRQFRNYVRLKGLSNQILANAIGFGGLWGCIVWAVMYWGTSVDSIFAGIVGAGMMSAGVISYRSIGKAASFYVLSWLPGAALALTSLSDDVAYACLGLLVCYVVVLGANINTTAERFITGCERERELKRSRDTIGLLLHQFTEQGADWLVEVDRRGRLLNPCTRLATATLLPQETLDGMAFHSLLNPDESAAELSEHFRAGRSFRNHIVSVFVGGEKRWWSLSAQPVKDGRVAYRGVVTDITAQREAEDRVTYLAHYDSLTDLPNRFHFNQQLYQALRTRKPMALMYIDLDNFKAVNDTLGHSEGDKLLKAAAERISSCLTRSDLLARLGGDEFAVILKGAEACKVDEVAARIVAEMGQTLPLGDHDVVVGTSIGIAFAPEHGDKADTLLRNADLALYAAKARGRNRAITFEPGMDQAAQDRRLLELDLRNALGKDEMRLHYQPLVSVADGSVTGHEALIRWVHPERGIVMPADFIPVAEETGLILQLGEWVLRQAIDDLAGWPEQMTVSINLSPVQMRSPTLISTMVNAIAANGVDPARICLEITETVLMQESEANVATLHRLRDLGVQIALDDFGTGYSSLNYLRSFPFSKIKIDRCFVAEIDSREDCRAIVRSVVSLAQSLGMTTCAEGIERQEQVDMLRAEGCGEVQGYLYSKAVPLEQLSDLRGPRASASVVLKDFDVPVAVGKAFANKSRVA